MLEYKLPNSCVQRSVFIVIQNTSCFAICVGVTQKKTHISAQHFLNVKPGAQLYLVDFDLVSVCHWK